MGPCIHNSQYNALEHAAKVGSDTCVKLLIEAGAGVKGKAQRYSALMLAAALGNRSCVEQLMEAGADVKEQGEDGMTAVMLAVREGYSPCMAIVCNKILHNFSSCRDYLNKHDRNRFTALMYAARGGHYLCVKNLASVMDNVDGSNKNGHTALMFAARGGHHLCIKMLIGKANHDQEDNSGETALMHAVRSKTGRLSFSDDKVDSSQCISLLLAAGADVNKQNCAGQTALMLAAQNGQEKVTHLLIGEGNMNEQDKFGDTALIFASVGNHVQCLKFLTQAGADVNMKNYHGETALISASCNGHMECLKPLIKSGAHVNYADDFGFTALKVVARSGHDQCLDLLIKAGADVNNGDGGVTPLMLASGSRQISCVTQLIKAGADVNFKGIAGDTALSYALKANGKDCVKMLIKAGADRSGHALICKAIKENCQLKEKEIKYAGASVNTGPGNALTTCLKSPDEGQEELAQLLFAAGEELKADKVPDYLKPPEQTSLMHLCRESIRKHLLQMSKVNLLVRVPKLGLPSKMTQYLFYGIEAVPVKNV